MKQQSLVTLFAAMALITLCAAAMAATPYYALSTSSNQVFMLGLDAGWGAVGQQVTYGGETATGLTGVAVKGNYAFVADSVTDKLYVLEMKDFDTTKPTFNIVNAISLSNGFDSIQKASSVAVDDSGNVYVIDSARQVSGNNFYSTYAFIDKSLINPGAGTTATINRVDNASFSDIAITSDGAIIVGKNPGSSNPDETYVVQVQGNSVINSMTSLNAGSSSDPRNYYPLGVVTNRNLDLAYIANRYGTLAINQDYGSVSVFDTDTTSWSKQSSTLRLPADMIPSAMTFFTRDSVDYLALIGTSKMGPVTGVQQALLYGFDASGNLSQVLSQVNLKESDLADIHNCAVSSDGKVFWLTNKEANNVTTWLTTSWGTDPTSFANLGAGLGKVVAFEYTPTPVPEPAGLVAMLTFATGLLGLIRKQRLG